MMGKVHREVIPVCVIIALWATNLFAQGPGTLWTRTYGGGDWDYGYCVQQTQDGGYVVTGYTNSFGAGEKDVYLIRTDPYGDSLWARTYGDTGSEEGRAVEQTADGGYVIAGWTESFGAGGFDVYLVKTDMNGEILWTKTYGGGSDDYGYSVQQTSDSGYVIVGKTYSFGVGSSDIYAIKTDQNGDTVWTRTYGGPDSDGGRAVRQTSDAGYIIVGCTESFAAFLADVYLVRTDAKGDTLWTASYGAEHSDCGWSVQQTLDGGYVVVGFSDPLPWGLHAKVMLVKTDEQGNALWLRLYGDPWFADAYGYSVQQTMDSGYIVAGLWAGTGPGDVYLIKTEASGDSVWEAEYGGMDSDGARSVQRTSDGGYIVAGYTGSLGAGYYDVYLIKMAPEIRIEEEEFSQEPCFSLQTGANLFADRISIQYELPHVDNIKITIYNLLGQEVRTLVDSKQSAGIYTVIWNGQDNAGRKVSSGTYFLRLAVRSIGSCGPAGEAHTPRSAWTGLATGEYSATRKVCVVR